MNDPILQEVLPEERLAKVVKVFSSMYDLKVLTVAEITILLAPHTQLEVEEVAHQERVLCLANFYGLREQLMERERKSIQRKSELFLQIVSRPEADALGLRIVPDNHNIPPKN